jgi:transposase
MMIVPTGVKVHLALGYTDMRKGMDGLAVVVQEVLRKDPFPGHLFALRGKRARCSKSCFGTETGFVCLRKGLTRAFLFGRGWPVTTARSR